MSDYKKYKRENQQPNEAKLRLKASKNGYPNGNNDEAPLRYRIWEMLNHLNIGKGYPIRYYTNHGVDDPTEEDIYNRLQEYGSWTQGHLDSMNSAMLSASGDILDLQQSLADANERSRDSERKLNDSERKLNAVRRNATRYAGFGGAGAVSGALAGLAWSLLSKKQKENKLRNMLLGGVIGGGLGLGTAALVNHSS